MEGLNLCLVVGLAVDYIVHLAEGYHMSKHTLRLERIQESLHKVGISVISGAISTMGAAFFMFFSRLFFFKEFGAFIFGTVGFSMVFSLFVFMAGYSLFGPQGYTGSYLTLCRGRRGYQQEDRASMASTNTANTASNSAGLENVAFEDSTTGF